MKEWLCTCGVWVNENYSSHTHVKTELIPLYGMKDDSPIDIARGRSRIEQVSWTSDRPVRDLRTGVETCLPIKDRVDPWTEKTRVAAPSVARWGHDKDGKPLETEKVVHRLIANGEHVGDVRIKRFVGTRGDAVCFRAEGNDEHGGYEQSWAFNYAENGDIILEGGPFSQIEKFLATFNGKTVDHTIDPYERMMERRRASLENGGFE